MTIDPRSKDFKRHAIHIYAKHFVQNQCAFYHAWLICLIIFVIRASCFMIILIIMSFCSSVGTLSPVAVCSRLPSECWTSKASHSSNSTLRLQYIIHYAYPRCEIPAQLNFQGRALFNKCFPEVTGTQFHISFKGIQKLIVAAWVLSLGGHTGKSEWNLHFQKRSAKIREHDSGCLRLQMHIQSNTNATRKSCQTTRCNTLPPCLECNTSPSQLSQVLKTWNKN